MFPSISPHKAGPSGSVGVPVWGPCFIKRSDHKDYATSSTGVLLAAERTRLRKGAMSFLQLRQSAVPNRDPRLCALDPPTSVTLCYGRHPCTPPVAGSKGLYPWAAISGFIPVAVGRTPTRRGGRRQSHAPSRGPGVRLPFAHCLGDPRVVPSRVALSISRTRLSTLDAMILLFRGHRQTAPSRRRALP